MTLYTSLPVFTQAVVDRVDAGKVGIGVKKVTYGIQNLIESFPQVAVEGQNKSRELVGTHKFRISFTIGLMIYHEKLQDQSITKKQAEQFAEAVEALLTTPDRTFGAPPNQGVIFSWVARIDPGIAQQGSVMLRSTRIILEAESRETF